MNPPSSPLCKGGHHQATIEHESLCIPVNVYESSGLEIWPLMSRFGFGGREGALVLGCPGLPRIRKPNVRTETLPIRRFPPRAPPRWLLSIQPSLPDIPMR